LRPWLVVFLIFKACALSLALAHHWGAALVVLFAPDFWLLLQFIVPSQKAFGPAVTSFETTRREVWLTLDDGPDPASTPRVLELLEEHGARATFFVIGQQVERYPELARRIVAAGHTLGNHTHTHPMGNFWRAGPVRTASEIERCVAALLIANVPFERFFRPPVGIRNFFLDRQLAERGMDLVLWNARGFDGGTRSPQSALDSIRRSIRPGAILLAHEAGPRARTRLEFVALLLHHLSAEGYTCVIPPPASLNGRR
jgi:peptidoglycan-N-acetylglucosamine deacetylase